MTGTFRLVRHFTVVTVIVAVSFVLLLGLSANKVYAANEVASGTCGDNLTWVFDDSETLIISGSGEMTDYGDGHGAGYGRPAAPWSDYNLFISKIVVDEGVTSIGEYAFYDTGAETVTLPDTLLAIHENAFFGARKMSQITLPNSLKSIENLAFSQSGLISVSVPSSVTSFGGSVFDYCHNLEKAELLNNPTELNGTFMGCEMLTEFEIPSSVQKLSGYTFGWSGITHITIPSSVKTIDGPVFNDCNSLKSIKIEEGLQEIIGGATFSDCEALETINLPDSLKLIRNDSTEPFGGCPLLMINVIEGSYSQLYVEKSNLNYKVICKNHSWNEKYTTDKNATCTSEGAESIHCSVCDAIKEGSSRAIAKTDHKYGDWSITQEATCTADGSREKTCSVCGDKVTEAIPATGEHNYGDWTITKEATCTVDGLKEKVCSVCGDKVAEAIPAIGKHNYGDWTVTQEATCTADGSREKVCSVCGDKVTEIIPAIGKHNYGDWTVTQEATCTDDGSREKTCSVCGDKVTEVIPATGHKEKVMPAIDATCTEAGKTAGKKCSVCGEILEPQKEIKAFGHDFCEWATTRVTTEAAAGVQTRTCSRCGEKETQEIAQLAPTLKAVKISKPKAAKKSATIKWKKLSKKNLKKIKKIEIQYSTDKNFKEDVKSRYANAKKTSYKIKKLKSKKKYYVRIRAYTKSGGQVHVSKWSATKSFKVK